MGPGMNSALPDGKYVPVTMRLDTKADGVIWDLGKAVEGHGWANDHYEQRVTISGELAVDDKDYHLVGVGTRDHSRGPRDRGDLGPHCWAHGGIPGKRRFIVLALDGRAGTNQRQVHLAMIFDADGAHPAEVVSVDMAQSAGDGGGLRCSMRLRTAEGNETFEAGQDPITTIALASPNQILVGAPVDDGIVSHCFHSPRASCGMERFATAMPRDRTLFRHLGKGRRPTTRGGQDGQ